jgi:hypothetical protein
MEPLKFRLLPEIELEIVDKLMEDVPVIYWLSRGNYYYPNPPWIWTSDVWRNACTRGILKNTQHLTIYDGGDPDNPTVSELDDDTPTIIDKRLWGPRANLTLYINLFEMNPTRRAFWDKYIPKLPKEMDSIFINFAHQYGDARTDQWTTCNCKRMECYVDHWLEDYRYVDEDPELSKFLKLFKGLKAKRTHASGLRDTGFGFGPVEVLDQTPEATTEDEVECSEENTAFTDFDDKVS